MGIPTFSSFQVAYRALQASQTNIDTTGHNISNVNTPGYTRQRVDLDSFSNSGYIEKYSDDLKRPGAGVEVNGVSQIRDPFLDSRYRNENANANKYDTLLTGIKDLENIFDEIETGAGLQNQLTNFINQLHSLTQSPTSADIALVVRTAAQQVTQMLNVYSQQVTAVKDQQLYDLTNVVVNNDFNSLVRGIADVNEQIRNEQLYGRMSNELLDKRNMLIDKLSGIANIKVTTSPEKVSDELTIENLTVSLYDPATGTNIGLVHNGAFNTLMVSENEGSVSLSLNTSFTLKDTPSSLNTNDVTKYFSGGSIKGYVDMINGKGAYADARSGENSFRGTQHYIGALDTFARTFAKTFNDINDIDKTDQTDKPLFSAAGAPGDEITARNISISDAWLNDALYITTSTKASGDIDSGGGDNVLKMISAMNGDHKFERLDKITMFEGTFNEYLTGMVGELSLDGQLHKNYSLTSGTVLNNLADTRDSISGVLLDEEGINMMAFQKAYSAASRYFTVLDEALDKLINGTGLVGR